MTQLEDIISRAWNDRNLLREPEVTDAVESVIKLLDNGSLRVAEPSGDKWQVNEWVKKAVILYSL